MVGGVHDAEENMSILCCERQTEVRVKEEKRREEQSRADNEKQRNGQCLGQ